jgi:hypothetical protein
MESVAILPQLFMLSRTGEAETITAHYLFALGGYRAMYLLNWIYRYVDITHSASLCIFSKSLVCSPCTVNTLTLIAMLLKAGLIGSHGFLVYYKLACILTFSTFTSQSKSPGIGKSSSFRGCPSWMVLILCLGY